VWTLEKPEMCENNTLLSRETDSDGDITYTDVFDYLYIAEWFYHDMVDQDPPDYPVNNWPLK
jgi:hypothetical protein